MSGYLRKGRAARMMSMRKKLGDIENIDLSDIASESRV
jgi:hypothetical protein